MQYCNSSLHGTLASSVGGITTKQAEDGTHVFQTSPGQNAMCLGMQFCGAGLSELARGTLGTCALMAKKPLRK